MNPLRHLPWGLAAILAALPPAAPAVAEGASKPRPNILFLLSDDHSYPYLGYPVARGHWPVY
jgi:hypothetical protein